MSIDDELADIIFDLANEARNNAKEEIPRYVEYRKLNRLFHFTSIHNLLSIAEHGLMGRKSLKAAGIEARITDQTRNEPIYDAICFSLSNPNYYMAANKLSSGHELVLVELTNISEILCTYNSISLPGNFGSSELKKQIQNYPEKFTGGQGLLNLFNENEIRLKYNIDISEPTDPQSEILILEPVDSRFIKNIYSPNGKDYAEQNEVRKITRLLPKHWTFYSQMQDLFPKIEWDKKGQEFYERKWNANWI